MRKRYSTEEKLEIVEGYFQRKHSLLAKAKESGYKSVPGCFKRWCRIYQEHGPAGLRSSGQNNSYTKEFKEMVVREYLKGADSLIGLAAKYKISHEDVLLQWVKCYNANIELKDYNPKREVYMASARRKTTLDERKVIAEYCIAHDKDYKGTAALFSVSYSQVYSWVRKYLSEGEEGLTDKHGHHKADGEVDELERLRRKIQRLERQLEDEKRTVALLKKVNELEGM